MPIDFAEALPAELTQDFALNHLVMMGGKASDVAQYFARGIPLPEAEETEETHVFKCRVGEETGEFASLRDDGGALVEDVGLIARVPSDCSFANRNYAQRYYQSWCSWRSALLH